MPPLLLLYAAAALFAVLVLVKTVLELRALDEQHANAVRDVQDEGLDVMLDTPHP